jgi:hypothetical protein
MPVNPSAPEPLKTALLAMEALVQSTKRSLAYAAPEMHDEHWAVLQNSLAASMTALYEEMVEPQ